MTFQVYFFNFLNSLTFPGYQVGGNHVENFENVHSTTLPKRFENVQSNTLLKQLITYWKGAIENITKMFRELVSYDVSEKFLKRTINKFAKPFRERTMENINETFLERAVENSPRVLENMQSTKLPKRFVNAKRKTLIDTFGKRY